MCCGVRRGRPGFPVAGSRQAQHNEQAGQGTHSTTPQNTHSRRAAARNRQQAKKKGGGQQDAKAQGTPGRNTRKARDNGAHRGGEGKKGGGGGQDAKAPGTRGQKTRKAGHNGGATRGGKGGRNKKPKKKKPNNNDKRGNPSPEGAEQAKSEPTEAKGKVRRTKTRPGGRPARPGQAGHAHAHTPAPPCTHSQWVVGPGSPPRGRAVGGGTAPDPGRPAFRQQAPPRGTLMPSPQHARARAVGLVTGPHARTPPHPQPVGSGPRLPAQRAGSRVRESARPRTPHTQARGAPPGHPQAAPTARKSARCGVGDGSPRPHPPAPTASG